MPAKTEFLTIKKHKGDGQETICNMKVPHANLLWDSQGHNEIHIINDNNRNSLPPSSIEDKFYQCNYNTWGCKFL